MTEVAFHRGGGRLLMALHLRPWKVLMKSLNVRKSLGVATVLSLSLLGSLSSAAIASADETPDPSASVITSTSPEPDSSTSASQSAADETPAPSSSPSASADDENAEIPEGSVDVVFSINGEKIKPGNFAKVDQSNRTLRVDYNLIVPEGVEKFANSFFEGDVEWTIVPAGTDPSDTDVENWHFHDFDRKSSKGSFEVNLAKLTPNKHYDLVLEFGGRQAVDNGHGTIDDLAFFGKTITLKDLCRDAKDSKKADTKTNKAADDDAEISIKGQTNGAGVAAGNKVGLPATGF